MTKDCTGRVSRAWSAGGDLTVLKCWAAVQWLTVWDVALLTVLQREQREGLEIIKPVPILSILLPLLPVPRTAGQARTGDHQSDWQLMNSFRRILIYRILEYQNMHDMTSHVQTLH